MRFQQSGVLHLGFVDDPGGYKDNLGSFKVRIRLLTPKGEPKPVPSKRTEPKQGSKSGKWWDGFRR